MRGTGRSSEGIALLEAAIVLPFLVMLMLSVANFGTYIYAWVTVSNATRALLQYCVYAGVVLGYPRAPSVAQMQNLVNAEVSSLPNSGSITWAICSNNNGTTACQGPGTAFTPDTDPQATKYTLYSAKVSYTFKNIFAPLTLPFGYTVTGLPVSVSRQLSMRSMQ